MASQLETKRILVVGPCTVGKTSMINSLTETQYQGNNSIDQSRRPQIIVSDKSRQNISYQFINVKDPFSMIDNKANGEEIDQYFSRVLEHAHMGLCLILYVFRNGTVHQTSMDIYNLFANIFCEKALPVVGVVTYCENEEPMSAYTDANRNNYERCGLLFTDVIATCFVRGGPLERFCQDLREDSTKNVWKMIETHSLNQNKRIDLSKSRFTGNPRQENTLFSYLTSFIFKKQKNKHEHSAAQTSVPCNPSILSKKDTKTTINTSINSDYVFIESSAECKTQQDIDNVQESSPDRSSFYKSETTMSFVGKHDLLTRKYQEKLSEWLDNQFTEARLIFKGSIHGRTARNFNDRCHGKGPTITIIQTAGGYVFGGYTKIPWSSKSRTKYDREAAIFTLKNPHHNLPETWYEADKKSKRSNITHDPEQGPTFGDEICDIKVFSDGSRILNSVAFQFPHRFVDSTKMGAFTFTGSAKTILIEFEVFECVIKPSVHQ